MKPSLLMTSTLIVGFVAAQATLAQHLRVNFRDVSQIELVQAVPGGLAGNVLTGDASTLLFRGTQIDPAQVIAASGWEPAPGAPLPFDFLRLELDLPEALPAAASEVVKERLADCARFAALVQARAERYDLNLRIDLGGDTSAVSQGDSIRVTLGTGGGFRCKLVRG